MGCDIHGYLEVVHSETYIDGICNIPRDRSYDWFGILADVRNYADSKPISHPKGMPEKVCYEMKDKVEGYGGNGHSHSWLSWKEIRDHDWDFASRDTRISTIDIETGKEKGKASYTYLQDDPEECKRLGVELKYLDRKAGDLIPFIWKGFLDFMAYLSEKWGDENVRIVFFFDN